MKTTKWPLLALTAMHMASAGAQAQTPAAARSALVIGLSQYAASTGAATLEGVPHDVDSAQRIAKDLRIVFNT